MFFPNLQGKSLLKMDEKRFLEHQKIQLLFALIMVFLPFILSPAFPGEERVALFGWRVPPVCPHRILYSGSCPGCGLIRSFTALTHGQLATSWKYHRMGIFLYILIALQIPARFYLLKNGSEGYSKEIHVIINWPIPFTIAALIINWLLG